MTELVVVLAIIGILAAIAIPTAIHYMKLAEFRKNESNAKTAYLAAESVLTWYRSSGQWEDFRREVIHKGVKNEGFTEEEPEYDRIYAILWDRENDGTANASGSGDLVQKLFEDSIYDKDFMNAAIAIEIDVETGQVYSAFYGTHCDTLRYLPDGTAEENGSLDISVGKREYGSRRKKLLGYYSVEDVTNVVELKPVRLKVTSINLVNSETLSLNWSGNSRHDNLDMAYTIEFYQDGKGEQEDAKLFSAVIDRYALQKAGWVSGKSAPLTLNYFDAAGAVITENWSFPLSYEDGRFSLTLDAMMSARLLARLEAGAGDAELWQSHNTSITRLGGVIPALCEPLDIYAVVTAECTYNEMKDDVREYTTSAPVTSNTENSMFADAETETKEGGEVVQAKLSRFRHLSNIRFYEAAEQAVFTLSANLDWTASGTGLYDLEEVAGGTVDGTAGADEMGGVKWVLTWKNVAGEETVDFPAIPMLSAGYTLNGNRNRYKISNLRLGAASLPEDAWIEKVYKDQAPDTHYSHYLGLFCEVEGRIQDLILLNPRMLLTGTGTEADGTRLPTQEYAHLYGVGLLCGRASGAVESVAVKSTWKQSSVGDSGARVEVRLANREGAEARGEANRDTRPAAIGGLIGVLADTKEDGDGELKPLQAASGLQADPGPQVSNLVMEGAVTGVLPTPALFTPDAASTAALVDEDIKDEEARDNAVQQLALQYSYGIGGIVGYAWLGEGVSLQENENHASVTGNLFTGGVCGNLHGNFKKENSGEGAGGTGTDGSASLMECFNDGLVLCSAVTESDGATGANPDGTSAEGTDPDNETGAGGAPAEEPLALEGRYFGGIVGFGAKMWIDDSSSASGRASNYTYAESQKKTLQGRYVGGILGYGSDSLLTGCNTKKGGYILGADYVGGIAGGLSTNIKEAIQGSATGGIAVTTNESYVIGWRYVGGIVGKNDGAAETVIENCINNGVAAGYDRYIGGIVGYNGKNGELLDCASYLSDYNSSIFNTIVSTWNAKGSYAGGLAGYNNGAIVFTQASESITVKSVSSVVVGQDYVGGVIGFNDTEGTLDVHYTLIGGQIYGYGDAVGGCIGLNASEELLKWLSDKAGETTEGQPGTPGGIPGEGSDSQTEKPRLTIRPNSVTGRYYVGGVIGANVVNLSDNLTVERIKTDNRLGSITGEAYVGGLIGYHRTITEKRIGLLSEIAEKKGLPATTDAYALLLPGLDDEEGKVNCPEYVELSGLVSEAEWAEKSPFVLTITDEDNRKPSSMEAETNNMSINARIYVGGIVGYCERESELILAECRNTGSISGGEVPREVLLTAYLANEAEIEDIELPMEIQDLEVSMVGGVISANLQNQIIDRCVNTGRMDDFVGLGGIVGFNAGGIFNCALEDNFGSVELDCIGGIAGLNIGSKGEQKDKLYQDVLGREWSYKPGIIAACSAAEGRNLFGGSFVGGIAGYNMVGGILEDNVSLIHVTAAGNYAGGIAGCNAGTVTVAEDTGTKSRNIRAASGEGVGGIIGWNQEKGIVTVKASGSGTGQREVVAVGRHVSIVGNKKVGGIVGINEGVLRTEESKDIDPNKQPTLYLACEADSVRAYNGYAGGIVGESAGGISGARNRSGKVTADHGPAGGIVAVNGSAAKQNVTIAYCRNFGDVNSDDGYAGGITAENYGTIRSCTVGPDGAGKLEVSSTHGSGDLGAIGAICAVNHGTKLASDDPTEQNPVPEKDGADGVIELVNLEQGIKLSGDAVYAGGIVGINRGIVGYDCSKLSKEDEISAYTTEIEYMPELNLNAGWLTVGGIAGWNQNLIQYVKAINFKFTGSTGDGFTNYRYLGGITGLNAENAKILAGSFSGIIHEKRGAVGNCYGGIAGENKGELIGCQVQNIQMTVEGIYTATATSTTQEKEELSSHVGGIAGKNQESGLIEECAVNGETSGDGVDELKGSYIKVNNGMAGGIAGFNKGTIRMSGDGLTDALMHARDENNGLIEVNTLQGLVENAAEKKIVADSYYVRWNDGATELAEHYYDNGNDRDGKRVTAGRMLRLTMEVNGNLGGITAYNAPSGLVEYCATGNWYLNNKSNAIGVGTGGIIGMNESEKDLSFLLNRAFVGRQLVIYDKDGKLGGTNRFAGGIIGNQNNTTKSGWTIANCVNYGTIYGLGSHYSGGILGQWTSTGGTVEKCRNYGNLQTTYQQGWFGAAAGIVAQIYHAYENNVYNIISCGNFGNIWGHEKGDHTLCANDSAGILGNVTTYEATSVAAGQHFTIQVLDCVNGPGVEIYSASMASGIVGFFSCDNVEKKSGGEEDKSIAYSTSNIVLRIERCRNYAGKLNAKNHVGGIFGDRYRPESKDSTGNRSDNTSGENTFLKDCYSVKRNSNANYSQIAFPIVSLRRNSAVDPTNNNNASAVLKDHNVEENYFIDEGNDKNTTSKTNVVLNRTAPSGGNSVTYSDPGSTLLRVASNRVYIMQVRGGGYFVARIDKTGDTVSANDCYINDEDEIIKRDKRGRETKVGKVLFYFPDSYGFDGIIKQKSSFDDYVRTAYYAVEGGGYDYDKKKPKADKETMPAPEVVQVQFEQEKGRGKIAVTPGKWQDGTTSDPFRYHAQLYQVDENGQEKILSDFFFYTENYEFDIPAEAQSGKDLQIRVQSGSMFENVNPSGYEKGQIPVETPLPMPEIRVELVRDGRGYAYRYELVNKEAYADITGEWSVFIKGVTREIELKAGEATVVVADGIAMQQLLVQARKSSQSTMDNLIPSPQVVVPVNLPKDTPEIPLVGDVKTSCLVSGTSLSDLSITVEINATNVGNVTTPPIYRAELVGTWHKGQTDEIQDVVFATQDILTAAGGTASATFTGLPETIQGIEDLRVRVWYAESGQGPVYTYHELTDETTANIQKLVKVETTENPDGTKRETPVWEYSYSLILDEEQTQDKTFDNYRWDSYKNSTPQNYLIKWLPAPVLPKQQDAVYLQPEYDEAKELWYTFRWDENLWDDPDLKDNEVTYVVSLTGIDQSGGNVSIVTNREITVKRDATGNGTPPQLSVNAETWNYSQVKLMVTRKGDGDAGTIGLTSEETYRIATRLERPAQPTVTNPDHNKLIYKVEWPHISPEEGCDTYQIYLQEYEADGSTLKATPMPIGDPVPVKTEEENYIADINLEEYAGKRVVIYVVAQTERDATGNPLPGPYVDSVDGVTYDLRIPNRISKPNVKWSNNWTDADGNPATVTLEAFKQGGLTVTVLPDTDQDMPPGGSTYLLGAYVFDTKENADAAVTALANPGEILKIGENGLLTVYPAVEENGEVSPVSMSPELWQGDGGERKQCYRHTLEGLSAQYAGKWIVPVARISSGGGQFSSQWIVDQASRLPYVKLPAPEVSGDIRMEIREVTTYSNPDLPDVNVKENWSVYHTVFQWSGVEQADSCYVTVTPATAGEASIELRILEPAETETGTAPKAWIKVDENWTELTPVTEENGKVRFDLAYGLQVKGTYRKDGIPIQYMADLKAALEVTPNENGGFRYTLILPDADHMETESGETITGENLRRTASVSVRADVKENDTLAGGAGSERFVGSDATEVTLGN